MTSPSPVLSPSHADLARWGAASIRESYGAYQAEFLSVTRRARARFEARDWRGAHDDALRRLEVRPRCIGRAVEELRGVLGSAAGNPHLRPALKSEYAHDVAERTDPELAKTFFNSVTRRLFGTVGVDPGAEFLTGEVDPPRHLMHGHHVTTTYRLRDHGGDLARLVAAALRARPFGAPWNDLEADARRAAERIASSLRREGAELDALDLADALFYRGKGAYVVGRLRRAHAPSVDPAHAASPVILALLHGDAGVYVDAVLLAPQDASIVFSFTRSYFHVEVARTGELVAFLKSILPQKKTSELYIAIGYNKHGKTVLYREIVEHLARTDERFEPAPGQRGMVMIVFTLPGLDVVFKVIRDRFAPPKTITRAEVKQKYALVFRHDRAGRLVDAQEFEHLVFDRARFHPAVLEELLGQAGDTVALQDGGVLIRHLYAERRVVPLDLFIRSHDGEAARDAIVDYGQAIRDLAATNTFPGDLLLKNFGVTRNGRVIFYDYDELCLVTDCRFRELPEGDDDAELSGEPWFYVGEDDVFPEEFLRFLGLPDALRAAFLAAHGEILTADFWRRMQERHRQGEIVDIFPYPESRRLGCPAEAAEAGALDATE